MTHTFQTVDAQPSRFHRPWFPNSLFVLFLCGFMMLSGCVLPKSKATEKSRPEAPPGFMVVLRPGSNEGTWALVKIPTKPSEVAADESPSFPAQKSSPQAKEAHREIERDLLERLNDLRVSANIPPLQPHPSLFENMETICASFNTPMEAGTHLPDRIDEGNHCLFAHTPITDTDAAVVSRALFHALIANPEGKEAQTDPAFHYVGFLLMKKDDGWHARQLLRASIGP